VWDAEKSQEVPTLKGHTDFVSSIAFSPDSKRFVTGSGDGRAKVWDTATGQELLTLNPAVTGSWNVAGLWGVAFSPDGQRILTGSNDKTAKVWDAATGRELLVLPHAGVVSSVAFSPDGKRILTGVGEWGRPGKKPGEAKVWDATTRQELLTLKHPNAVSSVAFSPDGKRIATGSGDQTVRVWDAATGQEILILKGHTGAIHSVAFSPDGRGGGGDRGGGARDKWRQVLGEKRGMETGERIVTGSQDQTAKVSDAGTGRELLALKGHTATVRSVAFSPDGERIVTGIAGANATAKVWSASPSQ